MALNHHQDERLQDNRVCSEGLCQLVSRRQSAVTAHNTVSLRDTESLSRPELLPKCARHCAKIVRWKYLIGHYFCM